MVSIPCIIWVHGYEALGWYRRLFNYTWYSPFLYNYAIKNTKQQVNFRRLIQYANQNNSVRFVFVSNWMKRITEKDTLSRIKQYDIIPNPVDIKLFKYHNKSPEKRRKILILRSFNSKKYANDISVQAILELSKEPRFDELSFTIIGEGPLFTKTLAAIKHFRNITIKEGAVQHVNIPKIHEEHGIFLCPTRQDAQGVSMCEAMSSGLVPISSNNTAIPEFVIDRESGVLTNSAKIIAKAINEISGDVDYFIKLSAGASSRITQLCDINNIIEKELLIIGQK